MVIVLPFGERVIFSPRPCLPVTVTVLPDWLHLPVSVIDWPPGPPLIWSLYVLFLLTVRRRLIFLNICLAISSWLFCCASLVFAALKSIFPVHVPTGLCAQVAA